MDSSYLNLFSHRFDATTTSRLDSMMPDNPYTSLAKSSLPLKRALPQHSGAINGIS